LELRNAQSVAAGNVLTFANNGTGSDRLKVVYAGAGSDLGNLLVQADATIDLGTNNTAEIRFGSATGWTAGKILTIANSTGGGKLYILSPTGVDLSQIKSLENPTWPASIDAYGLVTFTDPTPSGTTFTSWLEGTTATDELLLQYAFGAVSATQPVAHAYLPQASVTGGDLVLTYYVRQGALGLNVVPELSENLAAVGAGFAPSDTIIKTEHETTSVGGVNLQRRTASVLVETGKPKKFLHLKATQSQ